MSSQQRYISDELTHFVAKDERKSEEQYKILKKILDEGRLLWDPKNSQHWGENTAQIISKYKQKISENKMANPSMVCFCDIPVEDFDIHVRKYSPFGLSFKKDFIVAKGGAPVYYIPRRATVCFMEPHYKNDCFDKYCKKIYIALDYLIVKEENDHKEERLIKFNDFLYTQIFSYIKFFDHTLQEDDKDNYYFEREWRVLGNLYFKIEDVQRIIMPKNYAKPFRKDFPEYYGQLSFVDEPICR